MKRTYIIPFLFSILSVVPGIAETPEDKGRNIAEEADRRDLGWVDNNSKMTMVLRNSHGDESTRKLRRLAFENTQQGRGDKSIIIFDGPRDIKGTAILSHTNVLDADDQWLYLPALKRVKRISSANKSGPFVGSELAYEDLLSQEIDKYTYRWLRDETYEGLECSVIERIPRYENSGYARQVVWYDIDAYRAQRIDFYDRKNTLLKTLTYKGYQQYKDKFWRADALHVVNHQTGKSTELVFEYWAFSVGMKESDFTSARLKRIR